MDNGMPMRVFGVDGEDSLAAAIRGDSIGTRVTV
jgi:uridylate kinase